MDSKEIDALLNLLDDPDEAIYSHVREKLVSIGEGIIPHLENIWEVNAFGTEVQQRIEDMIHLIQYDAVYQALARWAKAGGSDLFEGALIVARYQYPDLDELAVRDQISKIRQDLWLELNDDLTALEKVKIFNHILYDVHGFRANKKNYHAAQNSYINAVLETRKGNPLSLSIIYLILADSLGVPIRGVNLPNHFLLAYADEFQLLRFLDGETPAGSADEMLFYINAFNRGTLVHKSEINAYLSQMNLEPKRAYFEPCSHAVIIGRLINNLIYSYERLGYPEKAKELLKLRQALGLNREDLQNEA